MKRWNHNKILWDSHNFHHGILLNCCTLLLAVVVSFSLCLICKQNFNIREKIVLHSKVLFYPCFQASTGHLLREGPYIRRSYCLRTRNLSPQNLFICVSLCSGITRWSLFFFAPFKAFFFVLSLKSMIFIAFSGKNREKYIYFIFLEAEETL